MMAESPDWYYCNGHCGYTTGEYVTVNGNKYCDDCTQCPSYVSVDEKYTKPAKKYIETYDQAVALAYFLAKERKRHVEDIREIDQDLEKLEAKWGVEAPDMDANEWVEV